MSDTDREAFEDWVDHKFDGPAGRHTSRCDGVYLNGSVQTAWVGWQAAKVHYTPTLTAGEIEKGARIMSEGAAHLSFDHMSRLGKDQWMLAFRKALRAAGVRFKDDSNA